MLIETFFTNQEGTMFLYFYDGTCNVLPGRDTDVEEQDRGGILVSHDFGQHLTEWDQDPVNLLLAANSMDVYVGPSERSPLFERMMAKAFQLGRDYEAKRHGAQYETKYYLGWAYDDDVHVRKHGPFQSFEEAMQNQPKGRMLDVVVIIDPEKE